MQKKRDLPPFCSGGSKTSIKTSTCNLPMPGSVSIMSLMGAMADNQQIKINYSLTLTKKYRLICSR